MKIRCPGCKSEYDFPEDRLRPEGTRVRCSACSTVFLVRRRAAQAPQSAPEPPAPSPSPAEDDLGAFFGGAPGDDATETAEDDLDSLFGASEQSDDLFGGGDDLFSTPGPDDEEDLFGTASDLFADAPSAETQPPAPAPPPMADDAGAADDDLNALFDDSDLTAPAPASAAAPASPVPDFDWDDEQEDAADATPEDDEEDAIEYGEAGFVPAIRDDDAREVLERTIVRDGSERQGPPPPRPGLIVFIVVAVILGAAAAVAVLQPELVQYVFTEVGLREPPAPEIYESPIRPVGEIRRTIVKNRNGFDVLVVQGELRNEDQQPHSFVMLRVDLVSPSSGAVVTSETVYAGNDLSKLQLRNFPADEMKRLLAVEMGEDLRNFNIAPGKTVPFMAIFIPAPSDYLDLEPRVIVLRSVAGEQ